MYINFTYLYTFLSFKKDEKVLNFIKGMYRPTTFGTCQKFVGITPYT